MIELLIIGSAVIFHICMVGFLKPTMSAISYSRCTRENHRYQLSSRGAYTNCNHQSDGFWLAFFWFFTVPFNVSRFFGQFIAPQDPAIKRQRELADADHRLAMAKRENDITAELEKASASLDKQLEDARKGIRRRK